MVSRTVRGSLSAVMRTAHQYLYYRDEEAKAKKAKPDSKGLREYIAENGELTPEGHIDFVFPEPVVIGEATYKGLRNQKTPGKNYIDEEKAQALAAKVKATNRLRTVVEVEVWDYDELYVLNQEGLVTDDQLDAVMETGDDSWSLVVIR